MSEENKGRKQWFVPKKDYPRQQGRELEFIRFLKTVFREFWELMKLNFLFILTCLGVVTIPAAITARNAITITMYRDKNHFLWRDYWKAFKTDFWRALLGGVIFGALLTLFFIASYLLPLSSLEPPSITALAFASDPKIVSLVSTSSTSL